MVKTHAVAAPFFELGDYVFGQEDDLSRTADKLVFIGAGLRSNEREYSGAIGRSDGEGIFDGGERDIKGQAESQLIQIELPAAFFVANENGNGSQSEVGVVAIRVKTAPVGKEGRRVSSGHRDDYSAGAKSTAKNGCATGTENQNARAALAARAETKRAQRCCAPAKWRRR